MDTSNCINLGILVVTAVIGVWSCVIARKSAEKAQASQEEANTAANRSALAAEESVRLQRRSIEMESQRHIEAALDAQRASLRATMLNEQVTRNGGLRTEQYLTVTNDSTQAPARNVRILIEDKPATEFQECRTKVPDEFRLDPRGEFKLLLKSVGGGQLNSPFRLKLLWDDDSGVDREWQGNISWR